MCTVYGRFPDASCDLGNNPRTHSHSLHRCGQSLVPGMLKRRDNRERWIVAGQGDQSLPHPPRRAVDADPQCHPRWYPASYKAELL